ncbi:MAG: hypothetical protein AB8I08_30030 [Sandaracinaceae bacterium]
MPFEAVVPVEAASLVSVKAASLVSDEDASLVSDEAASLVSDEPAVPVEAASLVSDEAASPVEAAVPDEAAIASAQAIATAEDVAAHDRVTPVPVAAGAADMDADPSKADDAPEAAPAGRPSIDADLDDLLGDMDAPADSSPGIALDEVDDEPAVDASPSAVDADAELDAAFASFDDEDEDATFIVDTELEDDLGEAEISQEPDDSDDDEPESFVIEADDEDGAITIEADEDEDALVVEAGDEDEDDWDDEAWAEIAAAEEAADAEADDRGAQAARRSVRSRKPRDEVFPMVGGSPEALRLRRRLLLALAPERGGGERARLLVSAAELAEKLGDAEDAAAHYREAYEADPEDVIAIRALRRLAVAGGRWQEVADLFGAEAKLDLSTQERASALTGLAEICLGQLDDPRLAAAAAQRARAIQPASAVATLQLAEARWRLGTPDATEGFAALRESWDDPDARAALAVDEARLLEHAGEQEKARELYAWANEVDPEALDAWFGRARTATGVEEEAMAAVEALAALAAYCPGPLGEAILTRASRIATRLAGDAQLGIRLLVEATRVLPLQARAQAAAKLGDATIEVKALDAVARAAGGTDRALALVRLAEVHGRQGDLDAVEVALRDAALADGSLGTIRVVRELIARRSGDVSRLADTASGGGLSAAARVARDPDSLERERELLLQASSEAEALVAADVLLLDVVAGLDDEEALDEALRRQADRVPPEQRAGSLLLLAERAISRDDLDGAEALLAEAHKLMPGDPLVLRPLGRLAGRRDADAAAALWMEEAQAASGDRAAHAATQAGRTAAAAGSDALGAYRSALDLVPGYGPAAWALKPLAAEVGDALTLGEVHEQLADAAHGDSEKAPHQVRGALLRAEADPAGASALLAEALTATPGDMVLQSLVLRLSGGGATAELGAMLAGAAESTDGPLSRVFQLQAGAAYEQAGDAARAATLYRQVAEATPADPFVELALDRAEIAAGEEARVASRRFTAVKEATSDEDRVFALERLAELDAHVRKDTASAMLSLQSILELAPGHLPSLRTLARYFAEQGRLEDATRVLTALALHVERGPDVNAHLRLARRLSFADPESPGDALDDALRSAGAKAVLDLWLAPRVLAAAEAGDDQELAYRATHALTEAFASPFEVASLHLRAAELGGPDTALANLRAAVEICPTHPLAAEALGHTAQAEGDLEAAAAAFQAAAPNAEVRRRAAELFYRAGVIYQDELGDLERARTALEPASERDVTYEDVFDRLKQLLEEMDDLEGLSSLYATRLAAGGDTAELVELYIKQAGLRQRVSDLAGAKNALRSALALAPERVEALRDLANLCLDDEDWRGAAEVLIRIARLRKEREELRWVFFTLGDIYDQHMPDPRRAEAAFRRVLKLLPQDTPAMERLAALYERENHFDKAAEMLAELARVDLDPDANRAHRIRLSALHEQLGDARKAESVLEEARRNAPTDLEVIRTLAEFYQRQEAANALAMHLSRAVNDFRHALEADLGDAAAWPGLVEVLRWKGAADSAAAAASAAQALGILDVEMSKLVDSRGAAPPAAAKAASEVLDELLAPEILSAPTRAVFRLAGEALEKSLPFELSAYHAEKVGPRDTSIRPIAMEVGRWFGVSDPQLYVTSAAPRVCVPVFSNPVTILIGSELLGITDDREKAFVLVRAFKIAVAQLSVVVRAQPHEVLALVGGLVQSYDPHHAVPGVDEAHIAEAARRVSRNVSRKARDELGPLVFEMAGRPGYDPSAFAMAASEWGNRLALVATGSAPSAVSALAKLSGERELPADPISRLSILQRFPEAATLLAFAVSDAHFESRRRVGLE